MSLSSAAARRAVGFRSRNASLERCAGAQLVRRDTGRTPTAPSHRCEEELEPSEHLVPNVIRLTREAYPSSYVDRPSLQQLSSEHHYPHRQHNPPRRCSTSPSRSTPSRSSPSSPRPTLAGLSRATDAKRTQNEPRIDSDSASTARDLAVRRDRHTRVGLGAKTLGPGGQLVGRWKSVNSQAQCGSVTAVLSLS
jgi:hypothetical protein